MNKLTSEQEARTQLEHRLEDALNRLYRQPKGGGFLSSLFSKNGSENDGDGFQAKGKRNVQSRKSFAFTSTKSFKGRGAGTETEASQARSLEVAQLKVASLSAELESTKEAQVMVLETKESVLRNLAKQTSQLTIERDSLAKRVNDMNITVDQLTRLLQSIQTRRLAQKVSTPQKKTDHHFAVIQGGGNTSKGLGRTRGLSVSKDPKF